MSEIDLWSVRCVSAYFGEVVYEPGGVCGPRVQPNVQMVVVDRGRAELELDGRVHPLAPGRVYCLWPGGREWFRFDTDRPTAHRWISLTPGPGAGRLDSLRKRTGFGAKETPWMRRLLRLGLRMKAQGIDTGSPMMVQLGLAYLAGFMESCGAAASGGVAPPPPPVAAALAVITRRLAEPLTLSDLAKAASVTPPHLVRLFRVHLRTTPIRLLWQKRIERGAELLQDTGLSVSQIADQVGFTSQFHYSRLHKQRFGLSPTQWRKRRWGGA